MRIIDKNTDYYDYLQDREDTLVFDRRGSFLLTKELFCDGLRNGWYHYGNEKYRPVLMQCGATYWLFVVTVIQFDRWGNPVDYTLDLLATWKNYDNPRTIISLNLIHFTEVKVWRWRYNNVQEVIEDTETLKSAIDHNNIKKLTDIHTNIKYTDHKTSYIRDKQVYPILTACGISQLVPPEDIYNALDEHFALNKSDAESTVAEGTTNKDKIVNHGFDTKTSFRGKP